MSKHFHAMNGLPGCIPDNNEFHTSRRAAIDSLLFLFDDAPRGTKAQLEKTGVVYIRHEVLEVSECHDAECSQEDF